MAESFLTQAEKISALEDSLAESQAVVVALLRASGRDIPIPDYYLTDAGDFDVTCTDDFVNDAKVFGVRRRPSGLWCSHPLVTCQSDHPSRLRDVRGPGGWRGPGPGRDHEHWELTKPEEPDPRPEQTVEPPVPQGSWRRYHPNNTCTHLGSLEGVAVHGGWAGEWPGPDHEHWDTSAEILPLSDQVQPLEPALPRIRSLALPDGRFAFVVSGWKPPEDLDEAQEFRVRMAGFARQCGAVATGVFEEHIEVG